MSRNRSLIRNLQLLETLKQSRYGLTLDELAREFGVCDRTIRRDLEALQSAGVPIVENPTEVAKRWRVVDWRKEAA